MAWMRECTSLVDMLYVSLKVAKTLGHVVFRGMTEVVKNAFEHVNKLALTVVYVLEPVLETRCLIPFLQHQYGYVLIWLTSEALLTVWVMALSEGDQCWHRTFSHHIQLSIQRC